MRGIAGVYLIQADEPDRRAYIGATKNLRSRWADHVSWLIGKTHDNASIQSLFNTQGISVFSFKILEFVGDHADLMSREQHWLDHYRVTLQTPMFNTSISAQYIGAYAKGRMAGVPKSAEHRAKIANAQAKAWARDDGTRKAALIHRNKTTHTWSD